mmetsp:Transcript_19205/g.49300  ORF Transcript_19205/g.49300 Transcript_19205/m.49300 type:complete len:442 (-) Transcript_19205:117-1442(-)|eukprot:jgi/Tetstr1/449713/TSEL_036781.t1
MAAAEVASASTSDAAMQPQIRPMTTGSTLRRRSARSKADVTSVASEIAKHALDDRTMYIQQAMAYHHKVDSARARRNSRLPSSKTTITTPKTLAYGKQKLVQETVPQWQHTWSNVDPHAIAGASQQLNKTNTTCLNQDMEAFNQEVARKAKEKELQEKKEMDMQKSTLMQSMAAGQKERTIMEKVYNRRNQEVEDRAMMLIQQERRNHDYKEKLKRDRAEATAQKAAEKEAKLEAARKRQEEIDQTNQMRKMELSVQLESRRRALVGKHRVQRAFEEKIERNRAHSARMRSRIETCQQEFATYCEQKHAGILAGLERTSKNREALVERRLEHVRSSNSARMDRSSAKLAEVLRAEEEYCMTMIAKFVKNEALLARMKEDRHAQHKRWLDATRAEIYDHFVRKEMLIDTLNTKKIREDFMAMWLQSYPIKEWRPAALKLSGE